MNKNNHQLGQVRIIGGKWRSRRLEVADLPGLRPTTDRVRETVFNWLAGQICDARVLDCFAGTGALGFESLSRYADFTLFIERNQQAVQLLKANLTALKCNKAEVVKADTLNYLQQSPETGFDLVFVDPPFGQGLVNECLSLLARQRWLNPGALIYVESEIDLTSLKIPADWQPLKEKHAGQLSYRLYQLMGQELR